MTTDIQVQDTSITLNGLRFHYRDWGNPAAPVLLLLHGFTAHARGWDSVARLLADQYRVLALDQRGHGETAWATDYTAERWVEDIAAFVEALGLQRLVLLGHSMGAWVAYMYAARHPEVVERLVLEDFPLPNAEAAAAPNRSFIGIRDVYADPDEYVQTALRLLYPDELETELQSFARHNLVPRADGSWVRRWDVALRRAETSFQMHPPEAQWAALASIRCPTLVLKAGLSQWPPDVADAMVRAVPNGRLVEMPNTRHMMQWADPAAFAAVVRAFLHEPAAAAVSVP